MNGPAFGKDVYGQRPVNLTTDGKATAGRISSAPQGAAALVKCKGKPSQACVLQYDITLPGLLGHGPALGTGQLILLGGQATVWQLTLGQVGLAVLQHVHHPHLHVTVVQVSGHHRRTVASGDVTG